MTRVVISLVAALCCLAGCSMKVIPEPVALGVINAHDNSQTVTKDEVSITVRNTETEISSYNLEGTVSSFHVSIANQSAGEMALDADAFLLVDDTGQQYFPLTPEKVKEIISRDNYYLIPYPYVGFYYLEDYEKASYFNATTSQTPYFYQMYPQDIYTMALIPGSIIPQAKIAGLVYFKIDLHQKRRVKLLIYKKGTSRSAVPDYEFPFKIEN